MWARHLPVKFNYPHACLLTGSDVTYCADYQSPVLLSESFLHYRSLLFGYHYFHEKLRRAFINRQAEDRFCAVCSRCAAGTVLRIDQIMKQLHVLGHRRIGTTTCPY